MPSSLRTTEHSFSKNCVDPRLLVRCVRNFVFKVLTGNLPQLSGNFPQLSEYLPQLSGLVSTSSLSPKLTLNVKIFYKGLDKILIAV
jgi:hypothetical protein